MTWLTSEALAARRPEAGKSAAAPKAGGGSVAPRANQPRSSRPVARASLPLRRGLILGLAFLALWPAPGAAGERPGAPASAAGLDWRVAEDRVSAQIAGWSLDHLLEAVARQTRWQVYLDPAADHVVSAKFRDLTPGEALRRLLGPLNYVLMPGTNSPARLYVFRDSRQAATLRIAVPAGEASRGRRLADELIVTLKPDSPETIEDLARRLGARIIGRSEDLHAYRLKFESAAAADAAQRELAGSDVRVDYNYLVERPEVAEAMLAGAGLNLTLKPKALAGADGVVVAMVDTAVQGRSAGIQDFLLPTVSVAGEAQVPDDQLAHGTSMSATLLRGLAAAPDAASGTTVRILPVDVYGNRESSTSYEIALGIQAAINHGADIVNLSLGGTDPSPFVHRLIQAGHERGVVFLAAAGNEPVTDPTFPAAYPEVIAVTALNRRGEVAAYANRGEFVDVAAPGVSYITFHGQPYLVVGTSPATAHASALAANLAAASGKQGPELEAEIRARLALEVVRRSP